MMPDVLPHETTSQAKAWAPKSEGRLVAVFRIEEQAVLWNGDKVQNDSIQSLTIGTQ